LGHVIVVRSGSFSSCCWTSSKQCFFSLSAFRDCFLTVLKMICYSFCFPHFCGPQTSLTHGDGDKGEWSDIRPDAPVPPPDAAFNSFLCLAQDDISFVFVFSFCFFCLVGFPLFVSFTPCPRFFVAASIPLWPRSLGFPLFGVCVVCVWFVFSLSVRVSWVHVAFHLW